MSTSGVCTRGRLLLGGALLLWVVGCVTESVWDGSLMKAVVEREEVRARCPETTVWLENRTGEVIHRVGLTYESEARPDATGALRSDWTKQITIDREPEVILTEKYPEPLLLDKIRVQNKEGVSVEYPLRYRCQPGEKVVLVLGRDGRVTAELKPPKVSPAK